MRVYVVRHADAGDRSGWTGDDRVRPLSALGVRQAEAIAKALVADVERLVTSPLVRCRETLRPTADATGVTLESDPRLAEGAGDAAVTLLEQLRRDGAPAAVCTHGDVMGALLAGLEQAGVPVPDGAAWPKASIWIVEGDRDVWRSARFVPAPTV